MKKQFCFVNIKVLMLSMVLILAGCRQSNRPFLTIGTSNAGGSWYPTTQIMAKIIHEEIPELNITVMPGGSISNIKGTSSGLYDIALAHTQDISDAINGRGVFKTKVTNLRGLMRLWDNYVQIAVRANSNINSIADLNGKRIAPGMKGWGGEASARLSLQLYDLTYEDMHKVEFTGWSGMVDLFKDKHIDAIIACSNPGISAFQEISLSREGIRILPFENDKIINATRLNDGYFSGLLPAGTYKGVGQPISTLCSSTILFTRDDLADTLVYEIVEALLKHKDELVITYSAFKDLTKEKASQIIAIPIHPGAVKFFSEQN